jgi:hypothetical protein
MQKRVGSVLRTMVLVAAIVGLITTVASARDRRHKGGTHTTPTVTAEQAVSTVKTVLPRLTVGSSFVVTDRRGGKRLEVPLILDGNVVSRVRLNPATGEILPRGLDASANTVSASPDQAVKIVRQALPTLELASVSLGREGEWMVDLTLKKAVVTHIRVHGSTGSVLRDWKEQESREHGAHRSR